MSSVVNKKPLILLPLLAGCFAVPVWSAPYPGVPTRDQNPLLQGYFIPAMPLTGPERWTVSHSLYITNTYQQDNTASERLLIDVENRRYDMQATLRGETWRFNINLSLIDNDAGFLDQTIEGWHDIFGLPQGGRDSAVNDRIEMSLDQNGVTRFDIRQGGSGIGDVQLAAGRPWAGGEIWFSMELPTGENDPLISNDAVDFAAWYARQSESNGNVTTYGLGGLVLVGDGGLFEGQLNRHFLFGQLGLFYRYDADWHFFVQADMHSAIVSNSAVDGLDHSLQGQFGLRLPSLMGSHRLDLFFSEDILPGHAPDITFSLRISPR